MRSERTEELLLVKYLLGHLSEEEQVRVEDRAFADRVYLNTLEAVEADLIDDYVRGALKSEERLAFEQRFLMSPQRREKVAFAKTLAQVSDDVKRAEQPARNRPSAWRMVLDIFRGRHIGLQFAAAAAALVCVATVWWLVQQNAAMRSRLIAADAQRQTLERQLSAERKRPAQVLDAHPPAPAAAPLIATLVLSSGLSRAESRTEQLVLSAGVQVAHIDVQLEPRDEYSRFRVELRTRRGEEILTRSNLARHRVGPGYAVSLDVPASALAAGDYEVAIKGIPAGGPAEDIGYYYFSVRRP
jgi:hypothetical protein